MRLKKLLSLHRYLNPLKNGAPRHLSATAPITVPSPYPDIQIPETSLAEFIWKKLDRHGEKTAVVCNETGKSYKFSEIRDVSHRLAQAFRSRLGLKRGDILAIMSPNVPDFCTVLLACLEAGIVVTTLNPIYTTEEISGQLKDSGAMAIVTLCGLSKSVEDARKALTGEQSRMPIITIKFTPEDVTPTGAIDLKELCSYSGPGVDLGCSKPEDLVFMPYSSGTTGLPKGVLLTNRNITANLMQLSNEEIRTIMESTGDLQDRVSAVLPFYHIYGLVLVFLAAFSQGAQLVTMPRFHPDAYISMIKKHAPTLLYTAPPIVIFLNNHPTLKSSEMSSVRNLICGAAPLAPTDIEKFKSKFPGDSVQVIQGYGLTEASPLTHVQRISGADGMETVGAPIPSTACRIVGIDDSLDKKAGESGEVWVKGPNVMKGYHNNPEATRETVDEDGWLHTGDIGHYNEKGLFVITDRLKELIKVKGFQVAPAELEGILRHHPEVLDAAVTGIDHPKWGQAPKAFIVKKPSSKLDERQIQDFIASKVAPFKQLTGGVVFTDSIPKNPSGKILRRLLKNL